MNTPKIEAWIKENNLPHTVAELKYAMDHNGIFLTKAEREYLSELFAK